MTDHIYVARVVECVGGSYDGYRFLHVHSDVGHTIIMSAGRESYRVVRHQREGTDDVAIAELVREDGK